MIRVFIRTRFAALHCWPDAPYPVRFLASPHRHEFHVELWKRVTHEERDIEFLQLKTKTDEAIEDILRGTADTRTWSCETWARTLGEKLGADSVVVSEDGENGSEWSRSP